MTVVSEPHDIPIVRVSEGRTVPGAVVEAVNEAVRSSVVEYDRIIAAHVWTLRMDDAVVRVVLDRMGSVIEATAALED